MNTPVIGLAITSPSKLERDLNCTGAPFLARGKGSPSPASELGKLAHKAVLRGVETRDATAVLDVDGVEDVDLNTAQLWEGHAEFLIQKTEGAEELQVERRLEALEALGMRPDPDRGDDQWRADLVYRDAKGWHVADYKSGKTPVPLPGVNKQLLSYAWALATEEGLEDAETVWLEIFQPETNGWTASPVKVTSLKAFGREVRRATEEMDKGGSLNPGEWCDQTFCPAKPDCPAYKGRRQDRRDARELAKTEVTMAVKGGEMLAVDVPAELGGKALQIVSAEAKREVEGLAEAVQLVEGLALGAEREAKAGELLNRATKVFNALEDQRTTVKAPVLRLGKAIDAFFKPLTDLVLSSKKRSQEVLREEDEAREAKRRAEEADRRREAERLERERKEAEEKAAHAKNAKDREAAAKKARELQEQELAVSEPLPMPEAKAPAGTAKTVTYVFDIPDWTKVPERFLLKARPAVRLEGSKALTLLELDGSTLAKDAKAGRLDGEAWVKVSEVQGFKASR